MKQFDMTMDACGKGDNLFITPGQSNILRQWETPDSVWNRAALDPQQVDPFCCTTAWQLSFQEVFAPQRNLIIKADGNSVIAFAEHAINPDAVVLAPLDSSWCFGSPLLGEQAVALLADTLPDIQAFYRERLHAVLISGIAPQGAQLNSIIKTFGSAFDVLLTDIKDTQCSASLQGGLDGYKSRRSAGLRKNIKKYVKRAKNAGIRFERCMPAGRQHTDDIYRRMLAVETASWKGIGKCGMAESPSKEYYRLMLHKLVEHDDARVIFARHMETDIGYIFGGMAGNIYRGQQFSFDAAWNKASVGNLLQYEQISWLCEEGCSRYDMGPLMEYKTRWTEEQRPLQTWFVQM